jgi:hypothetical protein
VRVLPLLPSSEWVADWYLTNYYSASPDSNPPGPLTGSYRVLRGGGWLSDYTYNLWSAYRHGINPSYRNGSLGFRCAWTLWPSAPSPSLAFHSPNARQGRAAVLAL